LKTRAIFNKQSIGDISKGDFIAPSDVTVKDIAESWYKRKNDAGTYRMARFRTGGSTLTSISFQPSAT
jgi:hypothetical protein